MELRSQGRCARCRRCHLPRRVCCHWILPLQNTGDSLSESDVRMLKHFDDQGKDAKLYPQLETTCSSEEVTSPLCTACHLRLS